MFDPSTTDQDDLHGGRSPWMKHARRLIRPALKESIKTDVVVIGAGITGALIAEHLTMQGHDVCIVDREQPGLGSTVASTAMVLWEIDQPLRTLAISHGFDRAAHVYRQSLFAATGLCELITNVDVPCGLGIAPSLYLSAAEVTPRDLLEEHALRKRAGLPGEFLDHLMLSERFGLSREAALLSPGSASVDPVQLSQGLLNVAMRRGARLVDAHAEHFASDANEAVIELDNGKTIAAKWAVLATGYVLPDFLHSDLHSLASSFAICTPPQPPRALWPDDALIWEASEAYHYARLTPDRRIIIGGEDEETIVKPSARDRLVPRKTKALLEELARLRPQAAPIADFAWAGAFGKSVDGLPLIGPAPGQPRLLAAYGYGGNGITFSYLASRIIADIIRGDRREWFDEFSLERDPPGSTT